MVHRAAIIEDNTMRHVAKMSGGIHSGNLNVTLAWRTWLNKTPYERGPVTDPNCNPLMVAIIKAMTKITKQRKKQNKVFNRI